MGAATSRTLWRILKWPTSAWMQQPKSGSTGKAFAVRPRTQNERAIRDMRPRKHAGSPLRMVQMPILRGKVHRQAMALARIPAQLASSASPPEQIVHFGRVKQKVWGKPPSKWHRCPLCKNKFTGRQRLVSSQL